MPNPELKALQSKEYVGLERFPKPGNVKTAKFYSSELSTVCPYTGQPDFYALDVFIELGNHCLESKSFKLYLRSLREVPTSGERLAHRICDAVFDCLDPKLVRVTLNQAPRGGIGIEHVAERLGIPGLKFSDDEPIIPT